MTKIYVTRPSFDFKAEYHSFYQEWKESNETMVPWVISKDPTDFQSMVDELHNAEKGVGIPSHWVPDSTFWLVKDNTKIIGAVNIRHDLTPHLLNVGGHIGYGIRPSERRKGYATKLLQLSLIQSKQLGLQKVLVTCDATNKRSEKTIINNGGVRTNDFIEEDGNIVRRFWITT